MVRTGLLDSKKNEDNWFCAAEPSSELYIYTNSTVH